MDALGLTSFEIGICVISCTAGYASGFLQAVSLVARRREDHERTRDAAPSRRERAAMLLFLRKQRQNRPPPTQSIWE